MAIEHGAVFAAEVDDGPVVALAFHEHVLARKSGVIRITQGHGGGTAEAETVAFERDHAVLAVGRENLKFFHAGIYVLWQGGAQFASTGVLARTSRTAPGAR